MGSAMQPESFRAFVDQRWFCRGRTVSCGSPFLAIAAAIALFVGIKLSVALVRHSQISGELTGARIVRSSRAGALGVLEAACDDSSADMKVTEMKGYIPPKDGAVYSVMRAAEPSLHSRARVSVPQTIWQTARSHNDTPPLGVELFNSWTKYHQDYDHLFLDDTEVQKFVETQYNESVAQAFKEMPLGVMRADAVRYMMLYHYGGVYADMDTECFKPAETWAPHGCHFAVALENKLHFCQWAFASVAGHGALKSVLDLVIQRMFARDYLGNDHFVHHATGPAVFTEGILRYLQLEGNAGELVDMQQAEAEQLRAKGVCILTRKELKKSLSNLYGSKRKDLHSKSWKSWTDERTAFFAAHKNGSVVASDETQDEQSS